MGIEKKLLASGFTHVQHSVYFYDQPGGAMEFGFLVRRLLASFRFARAIRDLRGFEVKNCSALTDEVLETHDDAARLGKSLWP